jgi:hypothetical protein
MDVIDIPTEEVQKDKISLSLLKDKPRPKIDYEVPKVELSKNIQKFDNRSKVYTENPYAYNTVALKKTKPNVSPSSSASEMITNPVYNTIGKFLGVDTIHDWEKYYDKVYAITEWAKVKSGEGDINKLMSWIGNKSRSLPNMGNKNIDNLYLFARLYLNKK